MFRVFFQVPYLRGRVKKLGFPDSGTCDWPIEIIESIEPMQKVQENRCQSYKKSDNFLGKYTSRAISPLYMVYGTSRHNSFCELFWSGRRRCKCLTTTLPFLAFNICISSKKCCIFIGIVYILNRTANRSSSRENEVWGEKISSILFGKFVHQKVAEHSKFRKLHI